LHYLFIDTETTGLNPKQHGLIQIAGIIEKNNVQVSSFNFNVKPFFEDKIDEQALQVNKVSFKDLEEFPLPQEVFLKMKRIFDSFKGLKKMHFLAYNAKFDWDFVSEFFYKSAKIPLTEYCYFPPIDIMSLAAEALKEKRHTLNNFKLLSVAKALNVKVKENLLHDALYDTQIAQEIYHKITQKTNTQPTNEKLKPSLSQDTLF